MVSAAEMLASTAVLGLSGLIRRVYRDSVSSRRGPDNSVRVAVNTTVAGANNAANIFWCQLSTSGTIAQADLDTWTAAFGAAYKTNLGARMGSGVTFKSVTSSLFTPGGGVLQSTAVLSGTGTEVGTNGIDAAACKIVSWQTTVYWRGGKPRTYLPGLVTADTATNYSLTATEVSNLKTAAAGFRAAINALTASTITGTVLGFVSFTTGNVARPVPLFFSFTGANVHPRFGQQKRRLGRWVN